MGYPIVEADPRSGGTFSGNTTFTGDVIVNGGSLEVNQISAGGAPSGALISPAAAGNVNDGTHKLKVTYVTADGETGGGTASSAVTVVDKTINGKISWSSIPTSSNPAVTSRKLYRQFNGAGDYLLLATLSDNTTTTYTDNVANASLTTILPTGNSTGMLKMAGPVELKKGTDVASANDLILTADGNIFDVTGTTTINGIRTAGWQSGSTVILQFDGGLTLKNNTAPSSGFAKMQLAGAADRTTYTGFHIILYYDGTNWMEKTDTAGL